MTEIIEQGLMPKLGLAFSFGSEKPRRTSKVLNQLKATEPGRKGGLSFYRQP